MKVWLPGLRTWTTYLGKDGVYDWREVVRLERLAERKRQNAPLCRVCGGRMLLSQQGAHRICLLESGAGSPPGLA